MNSPFRTWSLRSRLTLGIVILSAIGFFAASLVTQSLLKSYLTKEVDSQLAVITSGTFARIEQSGIAHEVTESQFDDGRQKTRPSLGAPLTRIPTSTSLTLLDAYGNVVGGLGGDLNAAPITDYVKGLLPKEVAAHGEKPFTVDAPGADFRVIARALPNNAGTVVAAQSLGDLERTTSRLGFLFSLIGFGLLLLIALASRAVIRVGLRPLEDAEQTAEEIAGGNLSARMPEANPSTEVGRLVTSLNLMLARIEEAFSARTDSENKLRRFVADASHELRTPITAIRGFSELHRQGAVTGEKETAELIGRIEGESKRMGSLVEDLLLLARLDQAREMNSKPVDINKVVEDAVISARAAGPEHPVTLNSSSDEIFTLGDEARIHQVVANLLANARAHTPAGTPIAVSVASTDAGVEVVVADEGPGLSIEDQKRIFERFYRADSSRVRTGADGSGLGLSIVDAVMRAHGGSVSVESTPGEGATFTLLFPSRAE
ncbi:BaeS Signal transduction histidine kinase [Candidatus Nanopelagicaceae bacterium]